MRKFSQRKPVDWESFQRQQKWILDHDKHSDGDQEQKIFVQIAWGVGHEIKLMIKNLIQNSSIEQFQNPDLLIQSLKEQLAIWAQSRNQQNVPLPNQKLTILMINKLLDQVFSPEFESLTHHFKDRKQLDEFLDKQWNHWIHRILNRFRNNPEELSKISRILYQNQNPEKWANRVTKMIQLNPKFKPEQRQLNLTEEQLNEIEEGFEENGPEIEEGFEEQRGWITYNFAVFNLFEQLLLKDQISLNENVKSITDKVYFLLRQMRPEWVEGVERQTDLMTNFKGVFNTLSNIVQEVKKQIQENPFCLMSVFFSTNIGNYLPEMFWKEFKSFHQGKAKDEIDFFENVKDFLNLPVSKSNQVLIYVPSDLVCEAEGVYDGSTAMWLSTKYFEVWTPRQVWQNEEMRKQIQRLARSWHFENRPDRPFEMKEQLKQRGTDNPEQFATNPINQWWMNEQAERAKKIPFEDHPEFQWEKRWDFLKAIDPEQHARMMEARMPREAMRAEMFDEIGNFEAADREMQKIATIGND